MSYRLLSVGGFEEKKPSSFTRFALPFGYEISPCSGSGENTANSYEYCQLDFPNSSPLKADDWIRPRWDYLTAETGQILFEQAKWFKLIKGKNKIDVPISFNVSDVTIEAKLECVTVVLFDFPSPEKRATSKDSPVDLLQTGFLLLDVTFVGTIGLNDLINFNERFRYFAEPYADHFEKVITRTDAKAPRPEFRFIEPDVLSKLRLETPNDHERELDKGRFYGRWSELLLDKKFSLKEHSESFEFRLITGFGDSTATETDKKWDDLDMRNAHPDNRAYVWTCAILPREARQHSIDQFKEDFGHWVALLNVDSVTGPREATKFERRWAEPKTYRRWEHYGTYYGFTPHSGAMLSHPCDDPPTHEHFRYIYFDQILFLLYLRVGLFRFSAKLNRISTDARNAAADPEKKWTEAFRKLRWDLTLFTNLYQFPLLSNQQQAVEMYTIAREQMDVNELFDEVQKEIHNSYEYLETQEAASQTAAANRQTEAATKLTRLAAILLPTSLLIGLFGMDDKWLWFKVDNLTMWWRFLTFVGIVLLGLAIGFLVNHFYMPMPDSKSEKSEE